MYVTDLSGVVVPDLALVHLVGEREPVPPLNLARELLQAVQERHHGRVELKKRWKIKYLTDNAVQVGCSDTIGTSVSL